VIRTSHPRGDTGSASVEFIALTLILLVPLVYLVVAVGQIQAGTFAVQAGARDAARGAAVAGVAAVERGASEDDAREAASAYAVAATDLAISDFGISANGTPEVALHCSTSTCFQPGGEVRAHVSVSVSLPGVPSLLGAAVPLAVTVSAGAVSPIEGIEADEVGFAADAAGNQ
jgi:Flp pilus assembly protein TadG